MAVSRRDDEIMQRFSSRVSDLFAWLASLSPLHNASYPAQMTPPPARIDRPILRLLMTWSRKLQKHGGPGEPLLNW